MTVSESWRVFCAVELPANVRTRLQEHVRVLRSEVPDVSASWSRVENIHLTLKFFGNVNVVRMPNIFTAAARAVKQFSAFEIGIGGTGAFPKPGRPQVLWIGVNDSSGRLSALHKKLEEEFAAEGFQKEDRAFRPHLTIARLRRPEGARQLADAHLRIEFKPQEVTLSELIVFRSELSPKGSNYTAISSHQLNH